MVDTTSIIVWSQDKSFALTTSRWRGHLLPKRPSPLSKFTQIKHWVEIGSTWEGSDVRMDFGAA